MIVPTKKEILWELRFYVGIILLVFIIGFVVAYQVSISEIDEPENVVLTISEGQAKAVMIEQLTGQRFPPEIAQWAVVTFSGTSVEVETDKLNIWLGRNWESKGK